ncbi:MAG: hypothetical protein RR357_00515 [Clostridia bacterium]
MIDRFKRYLEKEFRYISPSPEAKEYRQEVLANLLDRAHEFKIKGMTDEDAIYDLCIDSLGDFKSTLKDFENRLTNLKKAAPKFSAVAFSIICIILFMTAAYLIVSFATKAWSVTWLIMVGGIFLCIIAGAVGVIAKAARSKKWIIIRLSTVVVITLTFVFAFLFMQIYFKLQYSWMTFLAMVTAILFADTTIAYIANSKTRLIMLLATVEVTAVFIYVVLGILHVVPWSPYWLIPVMAAGVDAAIVAVYMALMAQKNSSLPNAEELAKINEEYYTKWDD